MQFNQILIRPLSFLQVSGPTLRLSQHTDSPLTIFPGTRLRLKKSSNVLSFLTTLSLRFLAAMVWILDIPQMPMLEVWSQASGTTGRW
jgi:hypothetical protein